MISHCIRIIAFLLLAVYLPASALAAGSFVWCVGSDGHSAIEIGTIEGSHGTHANLPNSLQHFDFIEPEKHSAACVDRYISTANLTIVKSTKLIGSKPIEPNAVTVLIARETCRHTDAYRSVKPLANFTDFSPHLIHLRTVVLLN